MLLVFSVWHWVVIGVVILLLFGGKKIPELMRGLGSGIKEFKDATQEEEEHKHPEKKSQEPPKEKSEAN